MLAHVQVMFHISFYLSIRTLAVSADQRQRWSRSVTSLVQFLQDLMCPSTAETEALLKPYLSIHVFFLPPGPVCLPQATPAFLPEPPPQASSGFPTFPPRRSSHPRCFPTPPPMASEALRSPPTHTGFYLICPYNRRE